MTGKLDAFGWATTLVVCSWQVPAHCFQGYLLLHSAADASLPEPEAREPRLMCLNMVRQEKRSQGTEYLSSAVTRGQSIKQGKQSLKQGSACCLLRESKMSFILGCKTNLCL